MTAMQNGSRVPTSSTQRVGTVLLFRCSLHQQRTSRSGSHCGRRSSLCAAAWEGAPPLLADSITSTSNPYVKHCVRLRTSRPYREAAGRLLLSGVAPLTELAAASPDLRIWTLFTTDGGGGGMPTELLAAAEKCVAVSPAVMQKLAGAQAAAEVALPPPADLATGPTLERLLVLEGLQDPGNLGTLLRTALALGWQAAFLLPGCCDIYNDKVLCAARGAVFKLPCSSGTWDDLQHIARMHQLTCCAATVPPPGAGGADVGAGVRSGGVALVLGTEGRGLSAATAKACHPVSVPMAGDMESLNVAVAGSILMYALRRR